MKANHNLVTSEDYTRKVFRSLGIEHYLKPREDKKNNSYLRPNPFRNTLIE